MWPRLPVRELIEESSPPGRRCRNLTGANRILVYQKGEKAAGGPLPLLIIHIRPSRRPPRWGGGAESDGKPLPGIPTF